MSDMDWLAAEGISKTNPSCIVTGSDGFVGSHVVEHLQGVGWTVLPCTETSQLWHHGPVDAVFSLAATGDPNVALKDPAKAYENNVRIMVDTLEYARRTGARVLHVSSSEAKGLRGPYAGAKACQEVICDTYPDVPVTVVVTQSLFGERQQRDKLIPTVIRRLLDGDEVRLQHGFEGYARRPFLHARNLASALEHLAHNPTKRANVGSSVVWSVEDVTLILAAVLGVEADIVGIPAGGRPGHEAEVIPIGCDVEGWEQHYGTIDALRDVAWWYRDNPEWLPDALADTDPAHPAPAREARRAA